MAARIIVFARPNGSGAMLNSGGRKLSGSRNRRSDAFRLPRDRIWESRSASSPSRFARRSSTLRAPRAMDRASGNGCRLCPACCSYGAHGGIRVQLAEFWNEPRCRTRRRFRWKPAGVVDHRLHEHPAVVELLQEPKLLERGLCGTPGAGHLARDIQAPHAYLYNANT